MHPMHDIMVVPCRQIFNVVASAWVARCRVSVSGRSSIGWPEASA